MATTVPARGAGDIPLTRLDNADPELLEELLAVVGRVARQAAFTGGAEVEAFDEEFATYCGTDHAVGLSSGTEALVLALRALGIGPGDEVVVPANSFIATAEAVTLVGATPRFADVDPDTALVTAAHLEPLIGPRTRCLIPVHLYGRTVDLDPILELARGAGIQVVEDACQAHGAWLGDRRAGSVGVAGAFSFYPAKNLGAWGDGGALVTGDPEIADRVRLLRSHGERPRYHHRVPGTTARLDALQAAILRVKLRRLDGWNDGRRRVGAALVSALAGAPVRTPAPVAHGSDHVFHQFVVATEHRDALREHLTGRGIASGIHYPVPIHRTGAYASAGVGPGSLPVAESLAELSCSLPMHPSMTVEEIERVADAVCDFSPGLRCDDDGGVTTFRDLRLPAAVALVAALAGGAGPASGAQVPQAPAAPGLLAAYSFEETTGPVVGDGTGRGGDGRLAGARRTTAGRFGRAIALDTSRAAVTVPGGGARLIRRALTLEGWVRPAAARRRGWSPVLAAGPRRRPAYGLAVRQGGRGVRAFLRVGGRTVAAASGRRVRGWTHLATTYDGRVLRLYVDGDQAARRSVRGRPARGQAPLRMGGSFTGTIDEVRLYRRALSRREIRAGRTRATPPPAAAPGGPPAPAVRPPAGEPAPGTPVPVFDARNRPPTPAVDELPKQTQITKDGVTWTLSQPTPVGRFVTGDPYVVGEATVTAISPAPAGGRNGSVKNLPPDDDQTGFDSRTSSNRYRAALRSDPPVRLVPGDSLVSSISVDTVGTQRRWLFDRETGSPVRSISILTALAAPRPPDAFRPSYVGRGAPSYRSSDLRRELLPRLAKVAATPSIADFAEHFRRPWVDSLMFSFDNPVEYMPDYSREVARAVGMSGLLLSLDHTPQEKESLLVYLTQYGIDLHGLVAAGHPGWPAHGGHGSGRKLPIVLAGTLLGEPGMQRPPGRFGEDMQTLAGPSWTGAAVVYGGHYGSTGSGEYGPYEDKQPAAWPGTLGEDYRRCCTSSSWIGEALTARLVPGVQAAWGHAPFFDYADRWMTEDDTQHRATIRAQIGKNYDAFPQRKAWDPFVTNMWKAHR